MDGYTIYLVLLGVLALLIFCGTVIRKLLKKANIDLSDNQLDAVTKAVADAVDQVEEIQKKLVAAGGKPMGIEEKLEVTTQLAKELAVVAGVSKVKVEILVKLLGVAMEKVDANKVKVKRATAAAAAAKASAVKARSSAQQAKIAAKLKRRSVKRPKPHIIQRKIKRKKPGSK